LSGLLEGVNAGRAELGCSIGGGFSKVRVWRRRLLKRLVRRGGGERDCLRVTISIWSLYPNQTGAKEEMEFVKESDREREKKTNQGER
jgi:hypothetical protein